MVTETKIIGKNGNKAAFIEHDGILVSDAQSALDLLVTIRYETEADAVVLDKSCVGEEFFRLSSGIAGEVLQKYCNYQMKLVIYGDYSGYTSKPLKDFIYESNKGESFGFVGSREEAVLWLEK